MKTVTLNKLLTLTLASLFGMAVTQTVLADDTDIYVNTKSITASEPMVMFTLDYNAALNQSICTFTKGATAADIANACGGASKGWTADFVANYVSADDLNYCPSASNCIMTKFALLRASMAAAMSNLDSVKVGLMISHNQTCNPNQSGPNETGCSNGAYVMKGFKSIDSSDPLNTNKKDFLKTLDSIPVPQGAFSHPYQTKEIFFELYRYLTGQPIYNAHLGWEDYGNTDATNNLNGTPTLESPDYSAIAWDPTIESGLNYNSPLASANDCTKIYTINISFGRSNTGVDDSDTDIEKTRVEGGMYDTPSDFQKPNNTFVNVISKLYDLDLADGAKLLGVTAPTIAGTQNVTSFFIVDKVDNYSKAWATAGHSSYPVLLGTDPTALTNKIRNIFSQILSVSTTFVSASVPVNVFNRADYLDDVYMALFEAEKGGLPHWIGNLKKLKLMQDASNNWYIGDFNKSPAFGSQGRLNFSDLTFWTDKDGWDVQAFDAKKGEIQGLDGRSIDRGGAGQQIPGFLNDTPSLANGTTGGRTMYLEPTGYKNGDSTNTSTNGLTAFDANFANAQAWWPDLNADGTYSSGTTKNNSTWSTSTSYPGDTSADGKEALNILKWARGVDVMDEDSDGNDADGRPWLMSDPIHSRPLAINYGGSDPSNPDVRIILTGNDGFVHMFQNTDSSGNESGVENWAFIPRYGLRILDRLMRNNAGSPLHPYGVDGAPVAYTYDKNQDGSIVSGDGDKAYVYFGMRRGGRYYYALDVSNPDSPTMLWSISNNSTGFSELGLTFSTPKVAHLSYIDKNNNLQTNQPVLVFGGGYDTNKDARSNSVGTDDSMGNAIFIVNAQDGSLIWKAIYNSSDSTVPNTSTTEFHLSDMTDSIPSDVTVLDSDGNGSIDRVYVGDTGGHVFRVDLAGTDRKNWSVHTLANLGRHFTGSSRSDDRRFFHAPDVVQTFDSSGAFDAVLIGSGDRANPLDLSIGNKITDNWFYMIKDFDTTSGTTSGNPATQQGDLADLSNDCMQFGDPDNPCSATTLTALKTYGWKIDLTQTVGEKVLSRPITINGAVFFTTYLPPTAAERANSCDPLDGNGSIYALNLLDATSVIDWDPNNTTTTTDANGNTVDIPLGQADRHTYSGAGIPADVIVVRKGGENQAILPSQNYLQKVGGNSGYKTFWYVEGE